MKQHITVEQLNELSEKQNKTYWDWLKKHPEIAYDEKTKTYMGNPCMSIGQMIELLEEHYLYWGIYPRWSKREKCKECNSGWTIAKNEHPTYIVWGDVMEMKEPQEVYGADNNLCDALWGAVKQILEKTRV